MTERRKIFEQDIKVHDQIIIDKNRLIEATLIGVDVNIVETPLIDLGKETEPYTEKDIDKLMEECGITPTTRRGRKPHPIK